MNTLTPLAVQKSGNMQLISDIPLKLLTLWQKPANANIDLSVVFIEMSRHKKTPLTGECSSIEETRRKAQSTYITTNSNNFTTSLAHALSAIDAS